MKKRIALLLAMTIVASLASVAQPAKAGPGGSWVKVVVVICKAKTSGKIQAPMVPPGFNKGNVVGWSIECGKGKPTTNAPQALLGYNLCLGVTLGSKPNKDLTHIVGPTGPSLCNLKAQGFFGPLAGLGPWCGFSNGFGGFGSLTQKSPAKVTLLNNISWISATGGLLIVTGNHNKGAPNLLAGVIGAAPDQFKQLLAAQQGSCLTPNKGARQFIAAGVFVAVGSK